jgi:hypothetical protein
MSAELDRRVDRDSKAALRNRLGPFVAGVPMWYLSTIERRGVGRDRLTYSPVGRAAYTGSTHVGVSFRGLLTTELTGKAFIWSAGYGRSNASSLASPRNSDSTALVVLVGSPALPRGGSVERDGGLDVQRFEQLRG